LCLGGTQAQDCEDGCADGVADDVLVHGFLRSGQWFGKLLIAIIIMTINVSDAAAVCKHKNRYFDNYFAHPRFNVLGSKHCSLKSASILNKETS
jgi:hypothetical protein